MHAWLTLELSMGQGACSRVSGGQAGSALLSQVWPVNLVSQGNLGTCQDREVAQHPPPYCLISTDASKRSRRVMGPLALGLAATAQLVESWACVGKADKSATAALCSI
jgi:hypothetical protein